MDKLVKTLLDALWKLLERRPDLIEQLLERAAEAIVLALTKKIAELKTIDVTPGTGDGV